VAAFTASVRTAVLDELEIVFVGVVTAPFVVSAPGLEPTPVIVKIVSLVFVATVRLLWL
jgi:hypothetical protein